MIAQVRIRLLLDRLQKRGTPLEAIGIQSHLGAGYKFSETVFRDFLAELAGRGLKIIISELDITDGNYDQSDPVRDQIIADVYTRYLNVSLDQTAVKAVVTWGLCDGYNWNNLAKDQQHHRKDGRAFRPLPFDADLQPKPAFNAILSAFQSAPVRQKW
ncbi:MAG: endo-1,4-beta-xylanase [Asticcacaulis sp.]